MRELPIIIVELTELDRLSFEAFQPSSDVQDLINDLCAKADATPLEVFQLGSSVLKDPTGVMSVEEERNKVVRRTFELLGKRIEDYLDRFDEFMTFLNQNSVVGTLAAAERFLSVQVKP